MEQAPRAPPAPATMEDPPTPLIFAPFARTIVPSDRGGSLRSKPCLNLKNPLRSNGQGRRFLGKELEIFKADLPLDKATQQSKKRKGHRDD